MLTALCIMFADKQIAELTQGKGGKSDVSNGANGGAAGVSSVTSPRTIAGAAASAPSASDAAASNKDKQQRAKLKEYQARVEALEAELKLAHERGLSMV